MSEKIEVSKIVVKVGKKEIELSLNEARELQELLNATFGKKEPIYIPTPTIVIERPYIQPYYWTITWDNISTITYSTAN